MFLHYMCLRLMLWGAFSVSQEVILKRAADLVEALYGLPHNNQVRTHTHTQRGREKHKKKNSKEM